MPEKNSSTVKERLVKFIKYKGLTRQGFEKTIGASNGYVSNIINTIGTKYLNPILTNYPELNRDWLLYGEGEMLNHVADGGGSNEIQNQKGGDSDLIPLLPTEAVAGFANAISDGILPSQCRLIKNMIPGTEFAITITGDSMTPNLKQGDILYIRKINESAFIPWGNVVVLDTENGALVKEIFPDEKDEDYIIAKSFNPKYPPYRVEKRAIYGIYRILGSVSIHATL